MTTLRTMTELWREDLRELRNYRDELTEEIEKTQRKLDELESIRSQIDDEMDGIRRAMSYEQQHG